MVTGLFDLTQNYFLGNRGAQPKRQRQQDESPGHEDVFADSILMYDDSLDKIGGGR